jgi:hypothetical protein
LQINQWLKIIQWLQGLGRMLMLADKQEDRSLPITVGAGKTYDAKDFVVAARALNVTPHITKNEKPPLEHRW